MPDTKLVLKNLPRRPVNQDEAEVKNILRELENNEIKRTEYTNRYVAEFTVKDLFYYNPNTRKKRRPKRYKKGTKG